MKVGPSGSAIKSLIPSHRGPLWSKSHGGERCGNVGTKIPAGTVAEQVEDQIDARPGRDRLADCIPMLEQAFASWQDNGAAANFALVVAAVTPPRSRYLPGRRLAQR